DKIIPLMDGNNLLLIYQPFQSKLMGRIRLPGKICAEMMESKSIFSLCQQKIYPIFRILIWFRFFQESNFLRKVVKNDTFRKFFLLFLRCLMIEAVIEFFNEGKYSTYS